MILQDIETMTDAEKLALVKAIQENVASSKAKQVSMETGQYAKLVVDAIKKIKSDLEERYAVISAEITSKTSAIRDGKDGLQGPKGEKGDTGLRGLDGANGKDGINGKDGVDGRDGNGVADARIDFDGSLIITLDSGHEINAGEVVPFDVADKIKVVGNGGGTSQYVLDLIAALQTQVNAITGGLTYKGSWNASTNTPSLTSGSGTNGWYYVVSVAGSTNLNGVTDWQVGDWAIYNGTTWQKIDQTNSVTSVAGRTGAITLSNSDISGLGTMSTQNANAVAVTGGSIDGTTVGATTRSSGDFTTLSANTVTSVTSVLSFNASNSIASFGSTTAGSYNQLVIQNKSNSAGASTNYVLSNNLGTDSSYYGEFGMNASTYSSGTPADFFSLNNGVYFSSHDGDVTLGSGNGFKTYLAWGTAGQSAHVINASGAIGLNTNITGTTNFGTAGQVLTSAGSAATPTWATLSVTPANFASQTANTILAAPNGTAGAPTFRTLVAADVPTLNQNTTGSAGSVVTTGFSIVESGGKLLIKYGATTIASISSTGIITSATNIVSNGTP